MLVTTAASVSAGASVVSMMLFASSTYSVVIYAGSPVVVVSALCSIAVCELRASLPAVCITTPTVSAKAAAIATPPAAIQPARLSARTASRRVTVISGLRLTVPSPFAGAAALPSASLCCQPTASAMKSSRILPVRSKNSFCFIITPPSPEIASAWILYAAATFSPC